MVNVAKACVGIEGVDRSQQATGMQHRRQRTLKNPIHCAGIGLNSGQKVELVLKPAEPGRGIVFCRTDKDAPNEAIPALWEHAAEVLHRAVLVEHGIPWISGTSQILSAATAAGLDNLLIEVQGSEVPILDGSAEPFLFLLRCAGTTEQKETTRAMRILKPIEIKERGRSARLEPHDTIAVDVEITHSHPAIGQQRWSGEITTDRYQAELARARGFAFQDEIESLQAQGLAMGSTLEHGVIIGEECVLNEGGWRYPDEAVRHAVLVSVGDLRMAGGQIIGRFRGKNCGHSMILSLLRKMFGTPESWEWGEYSDELLETRMDPAA